MHFPDISTSSLRGLHDGVAEALRQDDATPAGKPKPFGVREHADWKKWARQIEAELTKRNEPISTIKF